MKIGDNVVLRGTVKGVTYGKHGFPHYLVTLPNRCETEFPKQYIEDLQQLNERQPVKVPQFVADWIERSKQEKRNLRNALNNGGEEMRLWFLDQENYDLFARAWLDGYEVEKEKRYYVRFKWIEDSYSYLTLIKHLHTWTLKNITLDKKFRTTHTRKQLEDAGFGWVFDCPGVEVKEVE